MWTVTLEVHTPGADREGWGAAARAAVAELLRDFGMCHVTVSYAEDHAVARFCVGGRDEEDAEANALAVWGFAVERVGGALDTLAVLRAEAARGHAVIA